MSIFLKMQQRNGMSFIKIVVVVVVVVVVAAAAVAVSHFQLQIIDMD
jgi:type II secretory pathway pseudopilin PulG